MELINGIKQRLELALKPTEEPTPEEALEQVSTHGVLRGPVDWVFPAWVTYVDYATRRITETLRLSEEERGTLLNFRDTMKRLLLEAWMQAKEKLTTLYKTVAEGTYRVEGNKLYALDGTWMNVREGFAPYITIRDVSVSARFPDVLKLPHERLKLFQLGWRASDEGNDKGRPFMGTAQPWQLFAWVATRYGELHAYVASVNLTHKGASVLIHITARSWKQKWSKDEAIDLVINHLRHGEWAPLLTTWLGDGKVRRKRVLRSKYEVIIIAKEPWKLGIRTGAREALVAAGKEAFERLREAAGVYGELLDLLKAHKWIDVKLATDGGFRAAYKLKAEKRNIDVLREAYRRNNGEIPMVLHAKKPRRGAVMVEGIAMYLHLTNSGSLLAEYFTRDVGKALAVAGRLESAGLRPNVVRSNANYVVYIATADLLRLAEKDEAVRRAVALYLAEKVKNGTPRQREIARKLLQKHPLFYQYLYCLLEADIAMR